MQNGDHEIALVSTDF